MSLITGCPACGTMFKVVPDQLKISEGWVRCGHCAEVFDAGAHLQQPGVLGDAQVSQAPADRVPAPVDPAPVQVQVPLDPLVQVEPQVQVDERPVAASSQVPLSPPASPQPDAVSAPATSPPYPPFVLKRHDEGELSRPFDASEPAPLGAGDATARARRQTAPAPSRPVPLALDEEAGEPVLEDVSFVRQARRRAFWRRRGVRGLLSILALALLALLAAQAAVQQRDRLAALAPDLRPLLLALCEPLQCRIGPPRQIEAIVIDSSSFNRLRADAYRLSVTLKNQAPNEVAMPSIELTLTDTQDQPLLRRVLAPRDLGPGAPAVIGAGAEWSTTLALGINGNGASARIAGYRLLAFYP